MKKYYTIALLMLLCCALLTGCPNTKETKLHTFNLSSIPQGAAVTVDGQSGNRTPAVITLPLDGGNHYLFLEMEGCRSVRQVFTYNEYPDKLTVSLDCDQN